jgi:hypothetical protein
MTTLEKLQQMRANIDACEQLLNTFPVLQDICNWDKYETTPVLNVFCGHDDNILLKIGVAFGLEGWVKTECFEHWNWTKTINGVTVILSYVERRPAAILPVRATDWPLQLADSIV